MTKVLVTKGAIVGDTYIKTGSILYLDEAAQVISLGENIRGVITTEFARMCGLSWRKLGRLIDADELVKCIEDHKATISSDSKMYNLAHKHIIELVAIQPTVEEV